MICIHNFVITIADLTHISLRWMIFIKSKWSISDLNRKNIIKVLIIRNYKISPHFKLLTKLSLINNGKKVHSLHNSENKLLIHCINREVYDIWMKHFSNLKCFRCEYKITCSRINEERSSRAYIKSVHWKERSNLSR